MQIIDKTVIHLSSFSVSFFYVCVNWIAFVLFICLYKQKSCSPTEISHFFFLDVGPMAKNCAENPPENNLLVEK